MFHLQGIPLKGPLIYLIILSHKKELTEKIYLKFCSSVLIRQGLNFDKSMNFHMIQQRPEIKTEKTQSDNIYPTPKAPLEKNNRKIAKNKQSSFGDISKLA